MRIISRKTLRRFVKSLAGTSDQGAVKSALDSWYAEVRKERWRTPADVKYLSASIVGPDRVVFNIKGNSYRLVVSINYSQQMVFIKWLGSHANYDKISVKTVTYEHQTD